MYKRILVAVDGSPDSQSLDEAIMLAQAGGGTLLLLNVRVVDPLLLWNEDNWVVPGFTPGVGMSEDGHVFNQILEKVQQAELHAETRQIEDEGKNLGVVIAEQAADWGADLIVAGTHGRKGVDRLLLGSVAENVVRNATVPVLLVRGQQN